MSLRVASRIASRGVPAVMGATQRRSIVMVPKLDSEAAMQAEAIQQIRARVQYQKELSKLHEHPVEEEVAEMWRWVNLTFAVGVPIVLLSAFYSYFFDVHPHRFEGELPEYMNVRNKEYPWECGECNLFDMPCWKKCREAKK